MEMLKMDFALDKSISNSELAVDNYAAIQIKATKKMLENTSDIKDNNDTRTLINKLNNDNTRYDYQSEKIIHALHHHGHHHGNHHGHHHGGNDYHGFHNYYNNNDRHRGGGNRGGGGGGD